MDFPYKTLLITGGTGTLAHAMVRYLLSLDIDITIRLLSRDEYKQKIMERLFHDTRLRFLLGDVRDLPRLQYAVSGIELVVHTAALKHIDKGEYDGEDFHKTNVVGTLNVLKACQMSGVQQAIFISSDKGCYPINLYGFSKGFAERLWIQGNGYAPHGTRLAVIRYGNVANSRGSVIEVWREVRATGKPLLLTDERMSRFWLTIDEAVRLVLWTAAHGLRGGVVVPHLPAFHLADLARAMIPEGQAYQVIGRRPGEKLAELLMTTEEQERCYWYGPSDRNLVCYVIPPLMQAWGIGDERALWTTAPKDGERGMLAPEHQAPYRSDIWRWQLGIEDLRQRLEII